MISYQLFNLYFIVGLFEALTATKSKEELPKKWNIVHIFQFYRLVQFNDNFAWLITKNVRGQLYIVYK